MAMGVVSHGPCKVMPVIIILYATYIFIEGMLHGLRVMIFYMRQALYICFAQSPHTG